MASGEVLRNVCSTKLKGTASINERPTQINTQVAEITKPFRSVDEMVSNGMVVAMYRNAGTAKRVDIDAERKVRVKGTGGHEVVLERAGGVFSFVDDVKSKPNEGWHVPKKPAKANNRSADVGETAIVKGYLDNLRDDQDYDESRFRDTESKLQ